MLYLNLFCVFVSKGCPKVIAYSLYAILVQEKFHRNSLLSDNGGNLYYHILFHILYRFIYIYNICEAKFNDYYPHIPHTLSCNVFNISVLP